LAVEPTEFAPTPTEPMEVAPTDTASVESPPPATLLTFIELRQTMRFDSDFGDRDA